MILKKAQLVVAGIVLGAVGIITVVLFIYINGLKADIASEKKRADAAEDSLALCEIEKTGLKGAISDQNASILAAEVKAADMRAQRKQAREQAEKARREADDAIAQIRREKAETHSCEVARQKLITEATGHEFE